MLEKNTKITSNLTNWLMVLLTIILVWGTLYYQHKNLGFAYRPYIGIVRIVKEIDTTKELLFKAEIKNTGDIPANNIKMSGFMTIDNLKNPPKKNLTVEKTAILFPEAIIKHEIWLKNELLSEFLQTPEANWKIHYSITYDGIHTKSHETTVDIFYDRKNKTFHYEKGYAK